MLDVNPYCTLHQIKSGGKKALEEKNTHFSLYHVLLQSRPFEIGLVEGLTLMSKLRDHSGRIHFKQFPTKRHIKAYEFPIPKAHQFFFPSSRQNCEFLWNKGRIQAVRFLGVLRIFKDRIM